MFLVAHELFDALPIHQFKYLGGADGGADDNWCEMVVKLEGIDYEDHSKSKITGLDGQPASLTLDQQPLQEEIEGGEAREQQLIYGESAPNTENVVKILQPGKFFSEDAKKDLKIGDTFEICPSANDFTKNIASLIELTKGAALVIDYGENHAFSNSFRGI